MNGEPSEISQFSLESLPNREIILQFPGRIYDQCVSTFQEFYSISDEPLLYHTYHEADGSPGHVDTVHTMSQLYINAVQSRMKQKELSYPDSECDPLELYSQARDQYPHIPEADLLSIVEVAFTTSAMLHDIGNVAESIDWKEVSESSAVGSISGYVPTKEMKSYYAVDLDYEYPELVAANMYWTFLTEFGSVLGLEGGALLAAQKMGADFIQNTHKDKGFEGAFKQLQLLDKVSLFSPHDLKRVFGLMHEWGVNLNRESLSGPHADAAFAIDPAFFSKDL